MKDLNKLIEEVNKMNVTQKYKVILIISALAFDTAAKMTLYKQLPDLIKPILKFLGIE